MVARRQADSHHSVEREVEPGEVHEEEVPEEFGNCPFNPIMEYTMIPYMVD